MSLTQSTYYIQIDDNEQEELLQHITPITNKKMCEKQLQKKRHVEDITLTAEATTSKTNLIYNKEPELLIEIGENKFIDDVGFLQKQKKKG
ncbi:6755_t:CDS:1, partial [Funneliformis geosporum]